MNDRLGHGGQRGLIDAFDAAIPTDSISDCRCGDGASDCRGEHGEKYKCGGISVRSPQAAKWVLLL